MIGHSGCKLIQMKKIAAMSPPALSGGNDDGERVAFGDYVIAAEEALRDGRLDAAVRFIELAYFLGDQPAMGPDRIH